VNLESQSDLSSKEILKVLIEYDKWKTEATFAHELKLEELRSSPKRSIFRHSDSTENNVSEEDLEFNKLTSYGACNEKHIGLIAKTKIWEGANDISSKLLERWYSDIQEKNILPLKDLREGRIKSLLLAFLWASGCSHRLSKWPDANDAHLLEVLKKDLRSRFSKFSKHSVVAAYESLKVFWKEINDYNSFPFNSTIIADILDDAYKYVNTKTSEEHKHDIKNSPLFVSFCNKYPQITAEALEKYYVKNRHNFVAAGVGALRKAFTISPPEELEYKFSSTEWPRKWHIYLTSYEQKWPEQIKAIIKETEDEQREWSKE
jgi:hypothetical protein